MGWGGICYSLTGGGILDVQSLVDYCSTEAVSAGQITKITNQLLNVMRPLWSWIHEERSITLRNSYGHLLPVNLLIQHEPSASDEPVRMITPTSLPDGALQPGERVRICGFAVSKANRQTKTMTLRCPDANGSTSPYYIRCRSPLVDRMASYHVNEISAAIEGTVIETRHSRLRDEVVRVFGPDAFDPDAETLPSPSPYEVDLPNPLATFEDVLNQTVNVNITSIHGDFNLENILTTPETGSVHVIDFSDARSDHVLHDLLRLEAEMIIQVIPKILNRHQLPLFPTLASIFWHLHYHLSNERNPQTESIPAMLKKSWMALVAIRRHARFYLYDSNDVSEYYRGLFLYLLGYLKYKNLDDHCASPLTKKMAFWGGISHSILPE